MPLCYLQESRRHQTDRCLCLWHATAQCAAVCCCQCQVYCRAAGAQNPSNCNCPAPGAAGSSLDMLPATSLPSVPNGQGALAICTWQPVI